MNEYPPNPQTNPDNHLGKEPIDWETFDWEKQIAPTGDMGKEEIYPPPPKKPPTELEQLLEDRPTYQPQTVLTDIERRTNFQEHADSLSYVIQKDAYGILKHIPGGKIQHYAEKLGNEMAKKRDRHLNESASFGKAEFGKQKSIMYQMHWDFFNGSIGVVAGEKFMEAVDQAVKEDLPLVCFFTSSGVRQEENADGLLQMQKMNFMIEHYKKKTQRPLVGVLLGQTWGGVSASAVPQADFLLSYAGTTFGFSGPKVIEGFTHQPVPPGAQTVEAQVKDRTLEYLVNDTDELLSHVESMLRVTNKSKRKLEKTMIPRLRQFLPEKLYNLFDSKRGFSKFIPGRNLRDYTVLEESPSLLPTLEEYKEPDDYQTYLNIKNNPNRADTEYLLDSVFRDVVPLYSSYVVDNDYGKVHKYPSIIGAIGRIGPQNFLIIGNQPSYQQFADKRVVKIPAGPSPEDLEYAVKMMKMGERLGLPLVFFTDTLGALPTIEAEQRGQSAKISNAITTAINYPHPVMTYVIGGMGSGGGVTTGPVGDFIAMVKNTSALWVAEPRSSSVILNKTANPTDEQIRETAIGLKGNPEYQKHLGNIDAVVDSAYEQNQPPSKEAVAVHVQRSIVENTIRLMGMSKHHRLAEREKRYRSLGKGIGVRKGVSKEFRDLESHQ